MLELYRRKAGSRRVASCRVIEHFDVVKNVCPSVLARYVYMPPNSFTFEHLEETLIDGVIVAIAASAHAADKAVIT